MNPNGYDSAKIDGKRKIAPPERKGEVGIFPLRDRSFVTAQSRKAYRNNSAVFSLCNTIINSVVGTSGGKCYGAETVEFAKWAKSCDFWDGGNLNDLLRHALFEMLCGSGDCVLIFDNGIIKGSGKAVLIDGDCIANIPADDLAREYGANAVQENGLVFGEWGEIIGLTCSPAYRGEETIPHGRYIALHTGKDKFRLVRNSSRTNEGRGVSVLAHCANLIEDISETEAAEVMAAKLNSCLGLVVTDTTPELPNGLRDWDDGKCPENAEDAEAQAIANQLRENAALRAYNEQLAAGNSAIIKLNNGRKVESFSSERPNLNVAEFIGIEKDEVAACFSVGRSIRTFTPSGSYTAYRGELLLARMGFDRWRKILEREILDFLADCVMPNNNGVSWLWDNYREVDEEKRQRAIAQAFANGLTTLQEQLGDSWREVVQQRAKEKAFCESLGIGYDGAIINGGEAEPLENVPRGTDKE